MKGYFQQIKQKKKILDLMEVHNISHAAIIFNKGEENSVETTDGQ